MQPAIPNISSVSEYVVLIFSSCPFQPPSLLGRRETVKAYQHCWFRHRVGLETMVGRQTKNCKVKLRIHK